MTCSKPFAIALIGLTFALGNGTVASAADHGDAPLISNVQGADIADVYAVLIKEENFTFSGVEAELDADLTYSEKTRDTETIVVRK